MTESQGITFLYFLSMKRLFSAKKKEVYANYLLNMRVNFAEKIITQKKLIVAY